MSEWEFMKQFRLEDGAKLEKSKRRRRRKANVTNSEKGKQQEVEVESKSPDTKGLKSTLRSRSTHGYFHMVYSDKADEEKEDEERKSNTGRNRKK